MDAFSLHLIEQYGYFGIAFLMFLEGFALPFPAELTMPFAGYLAARSVLNLPAAILAGTVGTLFSSLVFYGIGARLTEKTVADWLNRHEQKLTFSGADLRRADRWFRRYGSLAILISRPFPVIRNATALQAGMLHLNPLSFTLYSGIGSALVPAFFTYAGYLLGKNYREIGVYLKPYAWVTIGASVVGVIGWIAWRKYARPRSS
ncbi:DedA family protein [Patescibacteria group bacterium]|nr:DedA family protein [Patescibacteria group bacterium]